MSTRVRVIPRSAPSTTTATASGSSSPAVGSPCSSWLAVDLEINLLEGLRDHDVVDDAVLEQFLLIRGPDLKNVFQLLNVLDLWHPGSHVGAAAVVVKGLLDGVEDASVATRVVAHTSHVLPVGPVGRHIVVDEHTLVPLCSIAPVDAEVLGEEASNILPGSVGSVPCVVELSLRRVDQAHAGGALEESVNDSSDLLRSRFLVNSSRLLVGRLPLLLVLSGGPLKARDSKELGTKLPGAQPHVVSPQQLESYRLGALVLASAKASGSDIGLIRAILKLHKLLVDGTSRDAAKSQVSRELGTVIDSEKPVPSL